MITTPEEYFGKLNLIANANPPELALLPKGENTYKIDVSTREVEVPTFLGVERDHKAETIYFVVDRLAGYMDLSQTCCLIQYVNAAGNAHAYIVPFYDIYTLAEKGQMLIPWCLDSGVLEKAGAVKFSIIFYKISKIEDNRSGEKTQIVSYSLNTIPATSKVVSGMENKKYQNSDDIIPNDYLELVNRIDQLANYQQTYWTILN